MTQDNVKPTMADRASRSELVAELADEFAERFRRGEQPTISEFVNRCPEAADDIREVLSAIAHVERLAPAPHEEAAADIRATAPPTLQQLGDFRIIREVGRGGMGIVYEAEQVSLGRHVALKLLPAQSLLDSRHKKRFIREARAAARLHHTNIVPVFGVGEQDGLHYYVMQFIHGLGLDEVLVELQRLRVEGSESRVEGQAAREVSAVAVAQSLVSGRFDRTLLVDSDSDAGDQPSAVSRQPTAHAESRIQNPESGIPPHTDTVVAHLSDTVPGHSEHTSKHHTRTVYWQSVARIGLQAAQALQYAHDQGVIHRDVKPGNLLLDTRGGVWVTDFGLAKAADQQDLTQTGDILGTLRYMAPEQFDGNADARSDVFSLGLTLYELLTLKPAFNETDRHKLIKQVTAAAPGRLRTLDPAIPRDLETIVHKSIDREASHRYQSAGELADDLQRYLGDEPIRARKISLVSRFARWCRRNPAVAGLTTTIAVLLVSAAVVSGIAAVVYEGLRDKAEVAADNERDLRIEADEARDAAERAELLARRNLYSAHMNLARDALENTDVPRALDLLERHIPAPGEPDWRSFEWYYLLGLCNQDEITIDCGQSSLTPAFSPDGGTLAVGINGRQIELWNLEKREITRIIADPTCFGPVAFSPDGNTLASAGGGKLKLWDVATGAELRSMDAYQHSMQQLTFTRDGTMVISTDGGNLDARNIPGVIRVWEVTTGNLVHELRGHANWISSLAVSPDGERLMTAGADELRFWDLRTGRPVAGIGVKCTENGAASWSPDGRLIVTKLSPHTVVWDAETGEERLRFQNSFVSAFSPDGTRLATADFDSTVRLWDVATGRELSVFKGHSQWVFHVVFSPDGRRLASVGRDCRCKVWRIEDPNRAQISTTSSDRRLALNLADLTGRDRMDVSPDGNLLAVAQNDTDVAIVDVRTEAARTTFDVGSEIRDLSFSSDGRRLAIAHARGIQLRDAPAGTLLGEIDSAVDVWTVDISPDGRLLAAGTDDRRIEVYRVDPLETLTVLPWTYTTLPGSVAFSPDGRHLAVCAVGDPIEAHLWTVADWTIRCSLESLTSRFYDEMSATDLAFSPDGAIIALSQGTRYKPREGAVTTLFDVDTGTQLGVLQGDDPYHTAHAFSRDGGTLVTGTDQGKITLWDLNTLEERSTFHWDGQQIASLALSGDGQTLFSANSRSQVRIWRGASAERIEQTEWAGLLRRAREYADDGRWEEADRLFSHVLEREDSLNVRLSRARTYAELGRWNAAIADFRDVATSDGSGIRPWYELALAQLASGDEPAYRGTCAELLDRFRETRDPVTAEFIAWTISLRPQIGADWGELIALAARPFRVGEAGAASRKSLAAVLLRAGLYEDAVVELEAAEQDVQREENRTSAAYHAYLLAIAHARLGHLETARALLDAAERHPESRSPGWFREVTLRFLRDEAQAGLQEPPDPAANSPAIRGRAALDIYSRAIEVSADVPLLWRLRARTWERLGQEVAAAADQDRAVELEQEFELRRLNNLVSGPGSDDPTFARVEFVVERARYRFETLADLDGALKDCLFALTIPFDHRFNHTLDLYVQLHDARGTLDHADAEWLRNFSAGQLHRFYSARANYYQARGEHELAAADRARLEWNRELTARHDDWTQSHGPEQPDPWKLLLQARDHLILDEPEPAEQQLAAASAILPDDPEYWIARAGLVEHYGDEQTNEADWEHVVGLADGDPLPWIRRGDWFARQGQQEQADADFAIAASLAPLSAKAPFTADVARAWQNAWASRLHAPVEYTNSIGMTLRLIPPGEFVMGTPGDVVERLLAQFTGDLMEHERARFRDDGPPRPVRLTRPFYLGAFEVTRAQFREFVEATGYRTEAEQSGLGGWSNANGEWVRRPAHVWSTPGEWPPADDEPASLLTWNDARAFCDWLHEAEGLEYVLPTEAQWEFACRAGTRGPTYACAGVSLSDIAWTAESLPYGVNLEHRPKRVGQKRPNAFGLYDMLGNVWEHCSDGYALAPGQPELLIDPVGPDHADERVLRGGTWSRTGQVFATAGARVGIPSDGTTDAGIGFRVAIVGDLAPLSDGTALVAELPIGADAAWHRAVELAHDDFLPWLRRGEWYARRGDFQHATADFAVAASLAASERRSQWREHATDQPTRDDGPVTAEQFDELTRVDPENRERWFARAHRLARQGRWADALEHYVIAVDEDRLNDELLEYAALLLLNNQTQSYRNLCQEIARDPRLEDDDDRAREDYYRAGIFVLGMDNGLAPDATRQAVEQSAGRNPNSTILIWQGVSHLRNGDPAQAVERLSAAIASHRPALDQLAPALALANARLGRNDDARLWRVTVDQLRREPVSDANESASGDLHDWLRFCLWSREVEIEFDPETAAPATLAESIQAIEACVRRGELDRAAAISLQAIDRLPVVPTDEEALAHRMYAALAENEGFLSAVIAAGPEPHSVWNGLAWHYSRRARWNDAARCYQQTSMNPGDETRHIAFVLALAGEAGAYREYCLAALDRAQPVVPGDRALRLVEICIAGPDSGVDPNEVLDWLEQTRETAADLRLMQVISPIAYYRAGEYEQALREIPLDEPEHGVHPFVRACAHWKLGNLAQARDAFDEGIDHYMHPARNARESHATWSHLHWLNASLWYREAALLFGEDPLDMINDEPQSQENQGGLCPPRSR